MIKSGVPVIELTVGEHDIPTHPSILDAMHVSAKGGHTGYAAVPGTDELREIVATRVSERTGIPTTIDNVVITPGGQAGLFAAHMAALEAGDVALFCDPYYATYPGTLRGVGAVPRAIPCHPEHDFQPQLADMDAAAAGAKSILINSPNNPTGVVYSPETMQNIADIAQKHGLWVISDEVYDTQIWEGSHISMRALPGMADRTLVVGSMSKSHAMTGSRVGWVVGPADTIDAMINLSTHTTYGVPGYIQDAAIFAIEQGTALEDEISTPFARRRQIAMQILSEQQIIRAVPNGGAMYQMLDIRATGMTGEEFTYGLLEDRKIAVMPGESFGASAAGHIRVAMTVDDDAFAQALRALCDYAAAQVSAAN